MHYSKGFNFLFKRRFVFSFHWYSSKDPFGRFGGGWNWCLGFKAGGDTLIINLLIFSLTFSLSKRFNFK